MQLHRKLAIARLEFGSACTFLAAKNFVVTPFVHRPFAPKKESAFSLFEEGGLVMLSYTSTE
jgi:hypothetical protein